MNLEQIKSFAKNLAIFHNKTKNMKLSSHESGSLKQIKKLIFSYHKKRKRFSKKIQKILDFMKNEIENIPKPKKDFVAGFFSEFNPGHVLFEKNKLKYVIDWEIGKEEAFFDYGGSMVACFTPSGKKLDLKKFKAFVQAYNKERKLTPWEKEHLFDALRFGILKYGIWGFVDLKTGSLVEKEKNIDKDELNMVQWLMENKSYEKPKRIYILGTSGSGKTYLANILSRALKIPAYDSDDVMFIKKFTKSRPKDKRKKLLDKIALKQKWIIDGRGPDWSREPMKKADLIIWLQTPLITRASRIVKRYNRRNKGSDYEQDFKSIVNLLKYSCSYRWNKNSSSFKENKKYLEEHDLEPVIIKNKRALKVLLEDLKVIK